MKSITLDNVDFQFLLPKWMREDKADASLAESVTELTNEMIAKEIHHLAKWAVIDEMSERELDDMAWELNATWYKYDAPIDQKREIIKAARKIRRKIGTPWAVVYGMGIYFSVSKLEEWFEYAGTPGHYRISVEYSDHSFEDIQAFLRILKTLTKASQVLDDITIEFTHRIETRPVAEYWAVEVPECGTIYCGTYWIPKALGHSIESEEDVSKTNPAEAFIVEPPQCGTRYCGE
ncbi:MAG: phage tail protein [Lachnospiraceae bacterium]|nr:phage tail protein [Lachnospiraceae bacterium]